MPSNLWTKLNWDNFFLNDVACSQIHPRKFPYISFSSTSVTYLLRNCSSWTKEKPCAFHSKKMNCMDGRNHLTKAGPAQPRDQLKLSPQTADWGEHLSLSAYLPPEILLLPLPGLEMEWGWGLERKMKCGGEYWARVLQNRRIRAQP